MSTAPENDWRAQALQNMEQAEREQITPPHMTSTSLTQVNNLSHPTVKTVTMF